VTSDRRTPARGDVREGGSIGRGPLLLEYLPLFADDSSIGAALFGPERAREWPPIAALLEGRGLPKIDQLMGGRYVPAVRAFFDHQYGLDRGGDLPLAPDGVEDFERWKRRPRHRS
jgi:hypothetical protein